jgi:putative ABC transport system ATP-binding protein
MQLEATGLTRTHGEVLSLVDVSLSVEGGEVVAVMGPSGSGKSTLLFLLAGLDEPDSGTVRLAGVEWSSLRGDERAEFRRRSCGFVVQGAGLLPQATAAENVEVPLLLERFEEGERRRRVAAALERVGLAEHAGKLPDQLSGGVCKPAVVLADEPTGSLDSVTAQEVTRVLVEAASEGGAAAVLVTHDPAVARHAHRIVKLASGRVAA